MIPKISAQIINSPDYICKSCAKPAMHNFSNRRPRPHISLESVPEVRNTSGLAALALTAFASHEFVSAKEHALRLIELDPHKSYPQGILGDALVELSDYE